MRAASALQSGAAQANLRPVSTPTLIHCPGCAKAYKWRPELVGKRIACKGCGQKFVVAGGENETEKLLADNAQRGGYVVPKRRDDGPTVDPDDPTTLHNWMLPAVTLGLALLWRGYEILAHHTLYENVPLWHSTLLVLLEWLVVGVAVGIALIVTGAFAGLEMGDPRSAALKVASVALMMAAATRFFSDFDRPGDLYGMILGLPCILVLGFFLFAGMYRADLLESLAATLVVMFLATAALMILAGTIKGEPGLILGLGRPVT